MNALFKKLNYKQGQLAFVVNAPDSFVSTLSGVDDVTYTFDKKEGSKAEFVMLFAEVIQELKSHFPALKKQMKSDITLWICYPKKSSKKYNSDITRDQGWDVVGAAGYEGVRQVAIDEDWSALRFRKVEFIKKFTRNEAMALSKEGKKRLSK